MVHGGCTSIGCYAMTDAVVDEIWRLVTAALKSGQKRFSVHVFPVRMSDANLQQRRHTAWGEFWSDLKRGNDAFETAQVPPRVTVCRGRYLFARAASDSDGSHEIAHGCVDDLGALQQPATAGGRP